MTFSAPHSIDKAYVKHIFAEQSVLARLMITLADVDEVDFQVFQMYRRIWLAKHFWESRLKAPKHELYTIYLYVFVKSVLFSGGKNL